MRVGAARLSLAAVSGHHLAVDLVILNNVILETVFLINLGLNKDLNELACFRVVHFAGIQRIVFVNRRPFIPSMALLPLSGNNLP